MKMKKEEVINFWPNYADLTVLVIFLLIIFIIIQIIQYKISESAKIERVKRYQNELYHEIKQTLGADSLLLKEQKNNLNKQTLIFNESFLFEQGSARWKSAVSESYIKKIGMKLREKINVDDSTKSMLLSIIIEGHTNSDVVPGDEFGNWSLSAERAVTVVRTLAPILGLTRDRVIKPGRFLSIAGFADTDYKVDSNWVKNNFDPVYSRRTNPDQNYNESKRMQFSLEYNKEFVK